MKSLWLFWVWLHTTNGSLFGILAWAIGMMAQLIIMFRFYGEKNGIPQYCIFVLTFWPLLIWPWSLWALSNYIHKRLVRRALRRIQEKDFPKARVL